jgi:hypothetical protein
MFLCITDTSPDDECKVAEKNDPIDMADGKVRHQIPNRFYGFALGLITYPTEGVFRSAACQ